MESKILDLDQDSRRNRQANQIEISARKDSKKPKIDLIYNSKLKSNVIGRKIRTKTRFVTQDSARIDLIVRRSKGFSFCEFEDDHWCSKIDFSLFSQQNLSFKCSSDVEMSLEAKGRKRFKNCGV